jgi:hypothetical protein
MVKTKATTRRGRSVLAVALSVAVAGCATVRPELAVGGRTVELRPTEPKGPAVSGELLAVGPERMLVLTPEGVRDIPAQAVQEVRVRRHGLDAAKAWMWVAIGAIGTGTALSAACSSAHGGNCGAVLGVTAAAWALVGGPAAASLSRSSRLSVKGPDFTALKPYARFPQGLPEGVAPASLEPDQRNAEP